MRPIPGQADQVTEMSEPDLYRAKIAAEEIIGRHYKSAAELKGHLMNYTFVYNIWSLYVLDLNNRQAVIDALEVLRKAIDHYHDYCDKLGIPNMSIV